MVTVISETKVNSAKKNYDCQSCEAILEFGSFNQFCEQFKLTFLEKRTLILAKENNYKILKGESYNKQFNKMDNQTYTFRSIPAIHEICCKYDVYVVW